MQNYYVALLIFGIILLLLGLLGKVKAKELEVGTDSVIVRVVTTLIGSSLIIASFVVNPDIKNILFDDPPEESLAGFNPDDPVGISEKQRLAEIAEEKRKAEIAEAKRIAEKKRLDEIAEKKRLDEIAEKKRLDEIAEKKRIAKKEALIQNECGGRNVSVPSQDVATDRTNASLTAGDAEIDSDDWTSVQLSYSIDNSNDQVELNLTWHAQERNKDKSKGNTRINSSKTITIYKVKPSCPLRIMKIEGLIMNSSKEEFYQGEIHGYRTFPDTGSLKSIRVQVDADGRHDDRVQALRATLSRFTVKLGE
jgi:hypothetical protein